MGLNPGVRPVLENMTFGELARLIYRDHVTVKHSSRKRLAEEVDRKLSLVGDNPAQQNKPLSILGSGAGLQQVDAMSKMLIQYLLEAVHITSLYNQSFWFLVVSFFLP